MKILKLRFKNLNSLNGEWIIDFTNPQYEQNGIFSIVGPTGSGKSTILDAICLALYGQTPRLGAITSTSNEIMSRNTGECFAEVDFKCKEGSFRSYWYQHKARRKPGGSFQGVQRRLIKLPSEEMIEENATRVQQKIIQLTGMEFAHFTRSMLLAQGSFDKFLKADKNERSPILEQITQTEIYQRISKEVFLRDKEENQKLETMLGLLDGVKLLSEEEEGEINSELSEIRASLKRLDKNKSQLEAGIDWLESIDKTKDEIESLEKRQTALEKEKQEFEPQKERLEKAKRANDLETLYSSWQDVKSQKEENEKERALKQTEIDQKNENLPTLEKEAENNRLIKEKADEVRNKLLLILRDVREKDVLIKSQSEAIKQRESSVTIAAGNLTKAQKSLTSEEENKIAKEKQLDAINDYQRNNAQDAKLIAQLEVISIKLDGLEQKANQNNLLIENEKEYQKQISELSIKVEDSYKLLEEAEKEEDRLRDKLLEQEEKQSASRSLHELLQERDKINEEITNRKLIQSLSQKRDDLKLGDPCPLCGSKDHPYSEGTVPKVDASQRRKKAIDDAINELSALEKQIGELKQRLSTASKNVGALKIGHARLQNDLQTLKKVQKDNKQAISTTTTELKKTETTLLEDLDMFGIIEIKDSESIKSNLESRRDKWLSKQNKKDKYNKGLNKINNNITTLKADIKNYQENLKIHGRELKKQNEKLSELQQKRFKLFENKDCDIEERKAIAVQETSTEKLDVSMKALQSLKDNINTLSGSVKQIQTQIEQQNSLILSRYEKFLEKMHEKGFADEESYLAAVLPLKEREDIESALTIQRDRELQIKTFLNEKNELLTIEKEKKLTDRTHDELIFLINFNHAAGKKDRDREVRLVSDLEINEDAKQRHKGMLADVENQRKESLRWSNLKELIGSYDGSKFRNHVQELTLQNMIVHANKQLAKLSKRYKLESAKDGNLALNVLDFYQGGLSRSSNSLSGGESFLVSLALALGLSSMHGSSVNVDSLFLDEGFGTLDEEALSMALDALSSLKQDGKIIGIISHVSALRETVPTQIEIIQQSGGRSVISGPGCSSGANI